MSGALTLRGVGKRYVKYQDTPSLAYGLLRAWGRSRRTELWAVRDVDLDVPAGSAVGVIGRNGAGKSTLLQLLCGVTAPTRGQVAIRGRVAPLIQLGVGFHPELTGRENVFVNGTILGMSRREVAARLDRIVAFSELEPFIDTPVKFYSSGMFVRLGFSVAAHVDPDILLLDEVLAVGDLGFQLKCFRHLESLTAEGTTIVMVSHNMTAVEQHCETGVLLERGSKVFEGPVSGAVAAYHRAMEVELAEAAHRDEPGMAYEPGVVELCSAQVAGAGSGAGRYVSGEELHLSVSVRAHRPVPAPFLGISLTSEQGVTVYRESNLLTPFPPLAAGERATFRARVPLRLPTGSYTFAYAVGRAGAPAAAGGRRTGHLAYLVPPQRIPLYVQGRPRVEGTADLQASFTAADPVRPRPGAGVAGLRAGAVTAQPAARAGAVGR